VVAAIIYFQGQIQRKHYGVFTAEANRSEEKKRKRGYWLQSKPEAYVIHEDWYRCVKEFVAQSQHNKMAMRGIYTKTNKNSRGMDPAIKQECIGKTRKSADERINNGCKQNGTHHGMWHSAAVPPLFAGLREPMCC
jgi:hypothetical protein